ncbi:MAG: hypothetical protein IPK87_11390 [Planctomycetes bacterium]|nr:hypothetical protein [Planctomycetota bacterium]
MVKNIEMQDLKDALDGGRVFALYDNRGPGSYGARHIKGAKLLPVSEVRPENLPSDKGAMLVFY